MRRRIARLVQYSMVVTDFLDPVVRKLENFGPKRLDDRPITIEGAVVERLGNSAPVVADERAEITLTVSSQGKLEPIQPPYSVNTFMASTVAVDDHGLRIKTGDHSFEVVLVKGLEVPPDEVFFSGSHVSFLPRPVWSSSSMKARALAVTLRASW